MNKDEIKENDKEKILINPIDNQDKIEQFETDKIEYSSKDKNLYILKGIGSILSRLFIFLDIFQFYL